MPSNTEFYCNIPADLANLPQWVARKGKMPYNPKNGKEAKAGCPETWGTLAEALEAVERGFDGIGFEFHDNGLVGIDLDHVIHPETGELESWAFAIVEKLNSYVERSPSGTGLHIIAYGDIPVKGRNNRKRGIEMYKAGRYFTVTGDVFGAPRPVEHRPAEVSALFQEVFGEKEAPHPIAQRPPTVVGKDYLSIGLEKDQALAALWGGQRNSVDESGNDIALMNKLAYWCNRDEEAMIAAFLSSPYAVQKDSSHQKKVNRRDYLRRTAQRAIQDCRESAAESDEQFQRERGKRDFTAASPKGVCLHFSNPLEDKTYRYTLDDIGTARFFADTYRPFLRYLPEYKCWFTYQNGVWVQDEGDVLARQCAKRLADYVFDLVQGIQEGEGSQEDNKRMKAIRKHYGKYRSLSGRKTLLQDSQDELSGKAADFNQQPFLFNCLNGTLDLETMSLRPHNPEDFLSKQANVKYDPLARCERFEQFIEEITEGNKERARMLQKALGYAMKGEANEECYFNAVGEKTRNGKGTLFDTILQLFGSYGAQLDFNTIAKSGSKDGSRATPDLARLIGTRFVLSNEPDKGVFVNEALLKQITGNDDLTARPLYGAPIQFKPVFKLFITANSRPNVSDDSLFASDRVKILPFPHHFSAQERDSTLKRKLRTPEAMSGILNWLLEGYCLYCQEGLKDTPEMEALVRSYREENDYIGQFLAERVTFTDGGVRGRISVKKLRMDYDCWCQDSRITPLGYKAFKQELEKRDIRVYEYRHVWYVDAVLNRENEGYGH